MTVSVRRLTRAELAMAAKLLARGMHDNPINVRVFATADAERRIHMMARFFVPVVDGLYPRGVLLGAFDGATLVGVLGMAPPGRCQASPIEKLRIARAVARGSGIGAFARLLAWTGAWSRNDPASAHWHLGPVATDHALRGRGIGGAMLNAFCAQMDEKGEAAYLETDKAENVAIYRRFGFDVVAEAPVLGLTNWFMTRAAAR